MIEVMAISRLSDPASVRKLKSEDMLHFNVHRRPGLEIL